MKLIALLLLSLVALAQETDLGTKLDQVVNAYVKNRNFMGTAMVVKGGKILLEKGYGMANLELDVPNTPATKFRLGSITKQFTATAIMQLQEQKKLSVNDPACKYFEGCPDIWKAITIHQLLTHTSGIPSYTGDKDFTKPRFMRVPLTPVEIVLLSKDKPLDFEPGTNYRYDNTGYVFLGAIIEKVSGEKYADYLRKHIFNVLDMQDSGYDDTKSILKNRASGYTPGPQGLVNADYLDMSLPHAAGSLYSTIGDLYRWDRAFDTDKVLSKASRDAMATPVKSNYGYGLMLAPMHKHKQIGHGGGINGFSTAFSRFPDDDAVVIVLSNNQGGNPGAVANALAGTLFGEPVTLPVEIKAITLDSKVLDRYVGTYQTGPLTLVITNENGHLMIEPKGQSKAEAVPTAENVFVVKFVDATITFKDGGLELKQSGATLLGKKVN